MNLLTKFSGVKQVAVFDTLCDKDKEALNIIQGNFDTEMEYLNAAHKHLCDIPDLSKMAYCENKKAKSYNSFKTIIAEAIENATKTIAAAKKNFINNVIHYFEITYLIKTPIPVIHEYKTYTSDPIAKAYIALLQAPEIENILMFIQMQNNGLSFFDKGMRNVIDVAKWCMYRKDNVVLKGNKVEIINSARYTNNYGIDSKLKISNDCSSRKIMALLYLWEFRSFGVSKPCEGDNKSILADSYENDFVNFQYNYPLRPHVKAMFLKYYKNGKFIITFDSNESAYDFYKFGEFSTLQEGTW